MNPATSLDFAPATEANFPNNYAFALVLIHSKDDKDVCVKAQRAISVLQKNHISLNVSDNFTLHLQDFTLHQYGARRAHNQEDFNR